MKEEERKKAERLKIGIYEDLKDGLLDKDEYQKFLGAAGDELERLMAENQEVLKRLKESE